MSINMYKQCIKSLRNEKLCLVWKTRVFNRQVASHIHFVIYQRQIYFESLKQPPWASWSESLAFSMKRYSFFCLFRQYCIFYSPIFFSTLFPPTFLLKLVSETAVEHVCTYIIRMQSIESIESFCLSPICDRFPRKFDVQTSYIYIWTLQLRFRANICCAHQKSSGNLSHDCAFEKLYCLNNA